mgnify:CR=1 FL=1
MIKDYSFDQMVDQLYNLPIDEKVELKILLEKKHYWNKTWRDLSKLFKIKIKSKER